VDLSFVKSAESADLLGRRLAVSFHVVGSSGPMTWHSTALTTSYLSPPGGGTHGKEESDRAFPFSTTSWFFLDAVDVMAPKDPIVVAALGDSITNGSLSTLNGDDRWEDVLAYRLHGAYGAHVSVVNSAIGGNQVIGPATYDMNDPYFGGPSALQRLERDVLSLSGLTTVVWLEGINDFGLGMPSPAAEAVIAGLREGVNRMRARGIRVIGGTLTTSLNGGTPAHASPETDAKRKAVNQFIRTGRLYDGVADFDAATLDPVTGMLRPDFIPGSTTGGPGDRIHPNRAGYQAMGYAVDVSLFARTAEKGPTQ
jgi:lysophospholipase L1-like esterase